MRVLGQCEMVNKRAESQQKNLYRVENIMCTKQADQLKLCRIYLCNSAYRILVANFIKAAGLNKVIPLSEK